ncbi:MAG: metalloregulator ArsR/SmtB family transcription factor [Halieaceae bacterium]
METNLAIHADRMAALGNEARLGILKLLLGGYPEEISAGDISRATGIPNSTLSHHLDRLRREDLVQSRKDKQWIWYRANAATLGDLVNFLYHDCCSGCGVEIEQRSC